MKTFLMLLLSATAALAAEPFSTSPVAQTVMTFKPAGKMIIYCGKGEVSVDLNTGSVAYRDCEPDEAGKAFWVAVERTFPRK